MSLANIVNTVHNELRDHHHGVPRSPHWPTVEHRWLKNNPNCAACGGINKCQVHHKKPFHLDPSLELADGSDGKPSNLITLCVDDNCWAHLHIGHGGNYKAWNPDVEQDAASTFEARQKGDAAAVEDIIAVVKIKRRFD